MLPFPSSPSSSNRHNTTRSHFVSRLVLALALALLGSLCPVLVSCQSQQTVTPSPGLLNDQPLHTLTTSNSSVAAFNLTFAYINTIPLLLSNASSVVMSITAIFSNSEIPVTLPPSNNAGLHAFLFTSSALTSTCQRADPQQYGQCTISVTLSSPQPLQAIQYAVYSLNQATYGNTYTDSVAPHSWKYYVHYITYADLDVNFQLSPSADTSLLSTIMYISAAQQLFTPGYPYTTGNGTATIGLNSGQSCTLTSSTNDVPDWYIVGLYGFGSRASVSQLQLNNNVDSQYSSASFNGYAILSLLSLILAAGFIGLVVIRGCCMYRQWNLPGRHGSAYIADNANAQPVGMGDIYAPTAFHTNANLSGVLRTDRIPAGATEAEIAALPVSTYEAQSGAEGEERDDARCTICLDEYESGVSRVTTLKCAHSFHSHCANAWLRQRRHCPLCLQLIDQAHDVKMQRGRRGSQQAEAEEVELANIHVHAHAAHFQPQPQHQQQQPAPAVASPVSRSIDVASRTAMDDISSIRDRERDSVAGIERYSSAAQEDDVDMCAIEVATPRDMGRRPL